MEMEIDAIQRGRMEITKSHRRRSLRRISILATVLGAIAWLGWWILSPDFIDLDVPVPDHETAPSIWDEEWRAEVRWIYPDRSGCVYVVRRVGRVYPRMHVWKSEGDILDHLNNWCVENGWRASDIYSQGDPVIPEMEFLGEHSAGVRHYTKEGDRWGKQEGRIALAVWPIRSGEEILGFNVVLASVRPSFARRLFWSMD